MPGLAQINDREPPMAEGDAGLVVSPDIPAIRAALRVDEEDYDGAILDLRTALGEDPRNVTLLQLAATVQERNGNPELAGERLAAAMNASGYAPEVVLRYVRFLRGRGKMDAAETVLEGAVQRRPGEHELLAALGMARLQLRDWDGAEKAAASLRALGNPEAGRAADRIRETGHITVSPERVAGG